MFFRFSLLSQIMGKLINPLVINDQFYLILIALAKEFCLFLCLKSLDCLLCDIVCYLGKAIWVACYTLLEDLLMKILINYTIFWIWEFFILGNLVLCQIQWVFQGPGTLVCKNAEALSRTQKENKQKRLAKIYKKSSCLFYLFQGVGKKKLGWDGPFGNKWNRRTNKSQV